MEKAKLTNFISKYYLNGLIQSVSWNLNDSITTKFISDDKSLVGEVSMKGFNGEKLKMGVYNTDVLNKLISVLGNDINFKVNTIGDKALSLTIDDNSTTANFMLSDLAVIPNAPELKQLPPFQLKVKITRDFIDKFIKAKGALADVELFTVSKNQKSGEYEIVIGNSNTNSTRISLKVETEVVEDINPISFPTKYFREILAANKDCSGGTMQVSSEGLALVQFDIDGFDAKYYLVEISAD